MIAQDCLTGYIGVRGCGSTAPESGLWIHDHPGIPLTLFDKIADSERQTWKATWEAIEKRAIVKLVADIISAFARKYRLKRVTDNVKLPIDVNASTNQTAAAAQYRGFEVELDYYNSEYAYSSLQIIHLQQVKCYAKTAVSGVQFKIRDLLNGIDLETKTVNLAAGWNTIWTNKHFANYHLFVGYDATGVESVELILPSDISGCDCCFQSCGSCCDSRIRGSVLSGTSTTTGRNLFGLSGVVAVNCSFESVLCANKYLFRSALWYCMAHEAMRETMFTDRLNKYTTVDREIIEAMRQEFWTLYQDELEQVTGGIDLNDSCCIECDSAVQVVTALP